MNRFLLPLFACCATLLCTTVCAQNVGIGTSTPTEKLEVAGNLKVTGLSGSGTVNLVVDNDGKLVIGSADIGDITQVTAGIGLTGGGTTGPLTIDLGADNGLTPSADKVQLGGSLIQSTTITQGNYNMTYDLNGTGDFRLVDGGATRLIVEDGGNVGIGAAPSTQLHTTGIARFDGGIEVDGSTVIDDGGGWHRSYGNTGWLNATHGGGLYMTDGTWIRTYNNKSFYQNSGTMRTDGTFQVGSSGSTLNVSNGGNFAYQTNTLFANTSGNVGIGTSGPGQPLDVVGNTRTSGNFIGRIAVEDTRSTNPGPDTYDNEVHYEFKQRAAIGVGGSGTYSGLMTIAPWGDDSGNNHHQLNFNEGGLFWRQGLPNSSTWGSWDELMTESNVNSFVNGDNLGDHNATTTLDMNNYEITEVDKVITRAESDYDKLRVYSSSSYTIGMHSGMTLGYLNDWAMTFTMNNETDRGWVWRDESDAVSDGAMSLTTNGNMYLKGVAELGGNLRRDDHSVGFLEGSYNNVAPNSPYSNPIYTIGSSYNPTNDELSNMYGIGYAHGNFWGSGNNMPGGWGQYVAADGDIRVILDGSNGIVWASSELRATGTDAEIAQVSAMGTSQGSGVVYVGQSSTYGGGMSYDGDGTPTLVGDNDRITFFRRSNGTDTDVMSYSYNSSNVRILGRLVTTGINESSDIRFKENVQGIGNALSTIHGMNGVTYNWKLDDYPERGLEEGKQFGLIAQELEQVVPELVSTDEDGYKSIKYSHIVPILIEAVKELNTELENKDDELCALRDAMESSTAQNDVNLKELNNKIDRLYEMLELSASTD